MTRRKGEEGWWRRGGSSTCQKCAYQTGDVLNRPIVSQGEDQSGAVLFALFTVDMDPIKSHLLYQDRNRFEPPAVDQPAEGMLNAVVVILACKALQIRSRDEDVIL